jgi:HSP20 family protein
MGHTSAIHIKPTREAVHDVPMSISNAFEEANALMETVARRAFEIFQERGRGNGSALDDWYRAEAEVLHEMHIHVAESDDAIAIWAEVPGFSAEQLEISVEPKRLAIRGKRTKNHTSEKIIYCEACADRIFRTVGLPVEIDPEKATAALKDGILEVSMPKAMSYAMVVASACSIIRAEDCRVWAESFLRLLDGHK